MTSVPFKFKPFDGLPEVILIEPRVIGDNRGWFMETYKKSDFERHGITAEFRQDNHSRSTQRGVLRGLHYQTHPHAQGKLVRCTVGEVHDVAVDIRRHSPTYGRWVSTRLSQDNRRLVWVPPGFAHAFVTMTEIAEVLYNTTSEYSPAHDRAIRWNDPDIAIDWPITDPKLSEKDAGAPALIETDTGFSIWDELP